MKRTNGMTGRVMFWVILSILFSFNLPVLAVTNLSGTVTYRDTKAAASSYFVQVYNEGKEYSEMSSKIKNTDNGGFTIEGLSDGTYYLKAYESSSAFYGYSSMEKITVSSGKLSSGNMNLVIEKAQFSGKISDGTATATYDGFSVLSSKSGTNTWLDYQTYVHSDGIFSLSGLSDGSYWIWISNDKKAVGIFLLKIVDGKCISSFPDLRVRDVAETQHNALTLSGTETIGGNNLQWTNSGAAPFVGYNIFRSTTPNLVMNDAITDFAITGNAYNDANIEPGKTYFYRISGVFADGSMTWATNEITSKPLKSSIILQVNNQFMTVNGVKKEVDPGYPTTPQNVNGRVLLPVRALVESMGGTVGWESASSSIIINYKGKKLTFKIGSNIVTVNGIEKTMDVPAQIIGGRTFVPVRILVESLGATPNWDGPTQTVTITYEP